jgi:hypothetical protein
MFGLVFGLVRPARLRWIFFSQVIVKDLRKKLRGGYIIVWEDFQLRADVPSVVEVPKVGDVWTMI